LSIPQISLKEAERVGKTILMGMMIEGRTVSKVGEVVVRGVMGEKSELRKETNYQAKYK